MAKVPEQVARFLSGKRIAVAGVSRHPGQAANAVFRKLRASGYEVFPVNPNASETEGARCYPDLGSVPGSLDGVVIVTHPSVSAELVRQCAARGVDRVWFHRSFGEGSVSDDAIQECKARGIQCIVGGCTANRWTLGTGA
jgi:predicted CoA-binding protein